jgi:AcrR family transcriptional regulator
MKAISDAGAAEVGPVGGGCRPLRADATRNRQRILSAAAEVFADRGLDATLDEVAEHAGVGVATVYRRFPNKEALVEALFEEAVNGLVDLAIEAAAAEDSWVGLAWFLEHATQMQADDLGLRDVVLHGAYGRDRVAQAKERITPVVAELIERAQRDGHLRPDLVTADLPIIDLMLSSVSAYTGGIAPELWRRYLGIMLDGLRTGRSSFSPLPPGPEAEAVEAALRSRHRR